MAPPPNIRVLQRARLADWCRPVASIDELDRGEVVGRTICTAINRVVFGDRPITLDAADQRFVLGDRHPDPDGRYRFPLEPSRIDCIPGAVVTGDRFIAISSDDRVFEETYWNPGNLDDGRLFRSVSLKVQFDAGTAPTPVPLTMFRVDERDVHRMERAVLIGTPWAQNYHHWLINSVARLWHLRESPGLLRLPQIVPAAGGFQEAALIAAGVGRAQLQARPTGLFLVDQLYVPTSGNFSSAQLQWLAASMLSGLGIQSQTRERRIYFSRADASSRFVENEDEVAAALSRDGFEIVVPGTLSFTEQVRMSAAAGLIVGPHGAGLTNALFAPAGAVLLDLHPRDEMNHCFWLQTAAVGQRYAVLPCEVRSPKRRMIVDIDRLLRLIDRCAASADGESAE